MASSTSVCSTRPSASTIVLILSPGRRQELRRKRHAQELRKDHMNGRRCGNRQRQREPERSFERQRRCTYHDGRGRQEAERVGRQHIEEEEGGRQEGFEPIQFSEA